MVLPLAVIRVADDGLVLVHHPTQTGDRPNLALGVTRVLVGDMADEGWCRSNRPAQTGDRPDLALLERMLYGLRSI